MPRRTTKRLPEHRYYEWPDDVQNRIRQNLLGHRTYIAELLDIDVNDEVALRRPAPAETASSAEVDPIRGGAHGSEIVAAIDLAIDDITLALVSFDAALVNENAIASDPEVRRILQLIGNRNGITEEEIEALDRGVRHHLAQFYPGGRERFSPGMVRSHDVQEAANRALASSAKPGRGRPKGTTNPAALKLANDLISLYESHSDERAARSVVASTSRDESSPNYIEAGRFLEFFEVAVGALPAASRAQVTRDHGSYASLIKRALSERKAS